MAGEEGSLQLQPLQGELGAQGEGRALRKFPHLDGCTPLALPADAKVSALHLPAASPAGQPDCGVRDAC